MKPLPFITDLQVVVCFEAFRAYFEHTMLEMYGKNWSKIFPHHLAHHTERNMLSVAIQMYARDIPIHNVALFDGFSQFIESFDKSEVQKHALHFSLTAKAMHNKLSNITATVNAFIFLINERNSESQKASPR